MAPFFSLRWPFGRGGNSKEGLPTDANQKAPSSQGGESFNLQEFGVTDRLCDFIGTFTADTFKSFPLQDSWTEELVDGTTASSSIRKDLTEWQERHAMLILSKVKEIAHLRYVLCPRHLKERDFWRIYFLLVKTYVAPYEMHARQKERMKMLEERNSLSKATIEVEMSESNHEIVLSTSLQESLE